MDLGLLKSSLIFGFGLLFFVGCGSNTPTPKKSYPTWVDDPSLGGTYPKGISACMINKNNMPKKQIKQLLMMKAKGIYSKQQNISVAKLISKKDLKLNIKSEQTSVNSFDRNHKILHKYRYNNEYCLHVEFK